MPYSGFDYRNYLDQHRLAKNRRFQPLFEAIENAFNAIEHWEIKNGTVRIRILRDLDQKVIGTADDGSLLGTPSAPVGFEIHDNGIGFTSKNWESFNTVYSPLKKTRGGKGIGRLSYLMAFDAAEFDSAYVENGRALTRSFRIQADSSDLPDTAMPSEEAIERHTVVRLLGFHHRLRQECPSGAEAIGRHIIQHFFRRLSVPGETSCVLEDAWGTPQIDLRQYCKEHFLLDQARTEVDVCGHRLDVTHVRCKKQAVSRHTAFLCASGRAVCELDVPTAFTCTKSAIPWNGQHFYYLAFVEGDLLERVVREDRMSLDLPADDDGSDLFGNDPERPSLKVLVNGVGHSARQFLTEALDPLIGAHRERVRQFCTKNVVLRPLLKHRLDELYGLPVGIPEEEFEKSIWQIYSVWKRSVRERFRNMARTVRENSEVLAERREHYKELLSTLNELAIHELATYLLDRKAVIDFLWERLEITGTGRFADENAIHDIFFPRRQTSEDVSWDESNLWLIDERLLYQQFVASDIRFCDQGLLGSESKRRPDVACYYSRAFDATFAFSAGEQPYSSAWLIEFKKPERTEYSEDDNPVLQIDRYVREIRSRKALTRDGHVFRLDRSAPIHVYVVCHMVDELREWLSTEDYIDMPDGEGVIYYLGKLNAVVQVVTYEKIIADARKRHAVFFEKLGIDA